MKVVFQLNIYCYCIVMCCLQIIRKAFHEKKSVLTKSCDVDLVTETDQAVEKLLIDRIKENFPNHM